MKKFICVIIAALMILALPACSRHKGVSTKQYAENMTDKGYKLPYTYDDGYTAYVKLVDGSEYYTISTSTSGSTIVHLTINKTEEEVKKFYEEYFSKLQKVRPIMETDHSTGYYDKDAREVLFNLNVWTADGKTNYSLGAAKCEDINKDKVWKLDDGKGEKQTEAPAETKSEAATEKAPAPTKEGQEPAEKSE